MTLKPLLAATGLLAATLATPASAVTFILNDTGGVGVGTQARAGFEAAAGLWSSLFTNDAVIRLDVGFRQLGSGILGSTGSARVDNSYTSVRGALIAGQTSAADASAVRTLNKTLSFLSNENGNCTTGVGCQPISATRRFLDNDGTYDNLNLAVNTTVSKALGLRADNGTRDASVTFSTAFTFDFDRSNGIAGNAFDFVGIAAHEIGHALGFVSGVDLADGNVGNQGLDSIAWGSVLDLFRYSGIRRDWTIGGTPCISVDKGASCVATLSTGRSRGDGQQASHWKDNLGIGIMDPTVGRGELVNISANDRIAYDIMGWNLSSGGQSNSVMWSETAFLDTDGIWEVEDDFIGVPEASTWAMMIAGFGLVGAALRRRRPLAA